MVSISNFCDFADCYDCRLNDVCQDSLLLKKTAVKPADVNQLSLF